MGTCMARVCACGVNGGKEKGGKGGGRAGRCTAEAVVCDLQFLQCQLVQNPLAPAEGITTETRRLRRWCAQRRPASSVRSGHIGCCPTYSSVRTD